MRHNQYYSLDTLNEGLWEEMDKFNYRAFKEHPEWTRNGLFLQEEAETLKAPPNSPYEVRQISTATVLTNSHVNVRMNAQVAAPGMED